MEIYELVNKLENELNAKGEALDIEKSEIAEVKSNQRKKSLELTKREKDLDAREAGVKKREDAIKVQENIIEARKEIAEENAKVEAKIKRAEGILKEAKEFNADADQKLKVLSKRELALGEEKKNYKAKIEKEFLGKFLKG